MEGLPVPVLIQYNNCYSGIDLDWFSCFTDEYILEISEGLKSGNMSEDIKSIIIDWVSSHNECCAIPHIEMWYGDAKELDQLTMQSVFSRHGWDGSDDLGLFLYISGGDYHHKCDDECDSDCEDEGIFTEEKFKAREFGYELYQWGTYCVLLSAINC
jgi:hypothetical protein